MYSGGKLIISLGRILIGMSGVNEDGISLSRYILSIKFFNFLQEK